MDEKMSKRKRIPRWPRGRKSWSGPGNVGSARLLALEGLKCFGGSGGFDCDDKAMTFWIIERKVKPVCKTHLLDEIAIDAEIYEDENGTFSDEPETVIDDHQWIKAAPNPMPPLPFRFRKNKL
jgi:hypothetical protein